MANYTQYDGNMSQSSMAQRLLDNGSDYIAVRISEYEYLFVQGKLSKDGSSIEYSGKRWIYNSRSGNTDLSYASEDSGTIQVRYPAYVYSNIDDYQSLTVKDVIPTYIFYLVFAFVLLELGFKLFRRKFQHG